MWLKQFRSNKFTRGNSSFADLRLFSNLMFGSYHFDALFSWLPDGCIFLAALSCASPFVEKSENEQSLDQISVSDIVELASFSGIGACKRDSLIAMRIDEPNIQSNSVNHRWVVVKWPLGKVVHDIDAGDSLVHWIGSYELEKPNWPTDCGWLYYRALRNGEVQVWGLNIQTGKKRRITRDEGNVLAFHLSPDERSIIYEADAPRHAIDEAETLQYEQGTLIDKTLYNWTPLFSSLPVHGQWRTMRALGLLPGHLRAKDQKRYRVVSLDDLSTRNADESETAAFHQRISGGLEWVPEELTKNTPWYPNGYGSPPIPNSTNGKAALSLHVRGMIETGFRQKYVLGWISRENPSSVQHCQDKRCAAERIIPLNWSQDDKTIFFISERSIDWGANILSWTLSSGEVRMIYESDGALGALSNRSLRCPIIDQKAICTVSNHGAPPQVIAIDLNSGIKTSIFDPNLQLRKNFSLKTKIITWTDKFGRNHNGILVFPRDYDESVQYPLIITTYRCPGFLTGGSGDGGPEYVLAEHGFMVLCIDSNDDYPVYEITSKESIGPTRYVAALAEYESAISMLARNGLADPARVGATGMSFSSQAVSFVLARSNIFHSVALTNIGVFEPSWRMFRIPDTNFTQAILMDVKVGEDGYTADQVYADISVSRRADLVSTAILIQTSDREYLGSLGAVTSLMASRKPVEMHVFPDETHRFHQPIHRYVNFSRNVDWFRFWLQDYEDRNPKKAAQYERWRKLRALGGEG